MLLNLLTSFFYSLVGAKQSGESFVNSTRKWIEFIFHGRKRETEEGEAVAWNNRRPCLIVTPEEQSLLLRLERSGKKARRNVGLALPKGDATLPFCLAQVKTQLSSKCLLPLRFCASSQLCFVGLPSSFSKWLWNGCQVEGVWASGCLAYNSISFSPQGSPSIMRHYKRQELIPLCVAEVLPASKETQDKEGSSFAGVIPYQNHKASESEREDYPPLSFCLGKPDYFTCHLAAKRHNVPPPELSQLSFRRALFNWPCDLLRWLQS